MGAAGLIKNSKGEILVLKSNYKEAWLLPGGASEKNESPKSAAMREIKEEIGLDIEVGRMLCIDYITRDEVGDGFVVIFDCGKISDNLISEIRLQKDEILDYKFVASERALGMVSESMKRRLSKCLEITETKEALYLENGELI